jgi:hypothetical protein
MPVFSAPATPYSQGRLANDQLRRTGWNALQTPVGATLPKRCRPSRLDNLAKRALTAHHDDLKEFLGGPELEVGVEMLILSVSNRAGVLHADRECTYHEYRHNRYIRGFP